MTDNETLHGTGHAGSELHSHKKGQLRQTVKQDSENKNKRNAK